MNDELVMYAPRHLRILWQATSLEEVKKLIKNGNIHAEDDFVLRLNAEKGRLEIVKYLIEQGADIHAKNDYALRLSSQKGHFEVVKFLIEQGADIHVKNDNPLRLSSRFGHFNIVKILIEQGADIHADDDFVLRLNAEKGRLEIVKYLIEQGADIHAKNDYALRMSAEKGHFEIVKYLIEQGADIQKIASTQNPKIKRYVNSIIYPLSYLYKNLGSSCNSQSLSNADILKLGKMFGIKDPNLSNICKEISNIFEKKATEISKRKCITDETLIGTPVKELHPMVFYSFNEGNKLYCGDIRELKQLDKNPWTRKKFDQETKKEIVEQYKKMKMLFKDYGDQDDIVKTVQNTIEMTLIKAMSNVLEKLRYPNNVEHFVKANAETVELFIEELTRDGVLTNSDKMNLKGISALPNKKLTLANTLNLKLSNDNTTVNVNGSTVSALRVTLEEIYNKYFTNE